MLLGEGMWRELAAFQVMAIREDERRCCHGVDFREDEKQELSEGEGDLRRERMED